MVLDANSGQVIGDIPNTPRFHGIVLLPGVNRGFTTKGGDSTVAIFDLKTLAPSGRVRVATGGLDGIMYDPTAKRIVLTNHSKPHGTAVAIDPASGSIVAAGALNEGPTGIAYDKRFARVFVGCSDTSVVVDPASGKVVATIPNGAGVDALGWDPVERLIYLPAGRAGNVTVVHQDDADHYRVIATVPTFPGAKTISVNTRTHVAYLFQPEYGPVPAPPAPARPGD